VTSHFNKILKLLLIDFAGSFLWFPVWWYTVGLKRLALRFRNDLRYRVASYGLKVWIKNFFVPMYGQHDLTGKLVSLWMRFVVLIGRLIGLVIEAFIYAVGLAVYAAAPAVLVLLFVSSFIQGAFVDQVQNLMR
jgi:hypothetical protein